VLLKVTFINIIKQKILIHTENNFDNVLIKTISISKELKMLIKDSRQHLSELNQE